MVEEEMPNEYNSAMERCGLCGQPVDECVCCEGCGHVCPLDRGELFCPVCKPGPLAVKSKK